MKKIIIILSALLLLSGCGKEEAAITTTDTSGDNEAVTEVPGENSATEEAKEGFQFEFNGVAIPMNADAAPVLESLGEATDYFEAPSCAFQGLDKIYYYPGFELSTYPKEDKDYISYVNFLDDSVVTDKDIYLGASLEEVLAAYGDNYTEDNGSYIYTLGDTKLTFILEEDTVTAITYAAIVEGLNN